MAQWESIKFRFTALDPLKPPVQSTLSALQAIESVLEALLSLIKPFMLDLLNPLRAIVAVLLAAIRALINQIRSTGFSVLLVHPDFSQSDFGAAINSVSGAYPRFEAKVIGKFFDSSDLFRPTYPPGSTVGMLIFYVGADSPGDLISQLFALLNLMHQPIQLSGLPAPISVQVRPVKKGGDTVAQFRNLFDSSLDKSLSIEWRMPEGPAATSARGFVGQLSAFYNSFRFPNFLIERTDEISPQGEIFTLPVSTFTLGKNIDTLINRYGFPALNNQIPIREDNGTVYRHFSTKIPVTGAKLLRGELSGSYRYLDNDPSLIAGKSYYYRIRPYFGNIQKYIQCKSLEDLQNNGLVKTNGNQKIIFYGQNVVMGKPSPIVKGYVPLPKPSVEAFNAYTDLTRAIVAGLMLNFEYPPAKNGDSDRRQLQKTGWGTLGMLGGQIGPLKSAFDNSKDFASNTLVRSTARRLSNLVLTRIYTQPEAFHLLANKWKAGAMEAVDNVLSQTATWKFIGIVGGLTDHNTQRIESYLAKEDSYRVGEPFSGPLPINASDPASLTVESRLALADFLQTAIGVTSVEVGYLSWYSVTVGDFFPSILPFVFDFEQFLLSFLKALESALKEIEDIIQTILKQIQSLEAILNTILALLDLLDIDVAVSVLGVGPQTGSAEDLATALRLSDNKPSQGPFGLHSGIVMTFGGPGQGSVSALNAIKFILSI